MKFKKIMLVSLILLAILTIGAASASQDLNSSDLSVNELDDEVVPDGDAVQASDDEDVVQASDDEDELSGSVEIDADDYEEIEKGDSDPAYISIDFPDDAKGTLYVYVNNSNAHLTTGKEADDEEDLIFVSRTGSASTYKSIDAEDDCDSYDISFYNLPVGTYTVKIQYVDSNNNKYNAAKTFTLGVMSGDSGGDDGGDDDDNDPVEIDVEGNMTIVKGDPDEEYPSINFPDDAKGKLYVYVNGNQARLTTGSEDNDEEDLIFVSISGTKNYIMVDAVNNFEAYEFSFYNLPLGNYSVKIDYVGNSGKYSTNKVFNLTVTDVAPPEEDDPDEEEDEFEDIDIDDTYFLNDPSAKIILKGPKAIIASLKVTLDGEYRQISKDANNVSYIDLSGLKEGTHEIIIFNDTDVLAEETFEIRVGWVIQVPDETVESFVFGENYTASLALPKDAEGKLIVEDEDLGILLTKSLVNGSVCISFAELGIGSYSLRIYYDGTDYDVEDKSWSVDVHPIISMPKVMKAGDKEYITFEMNRDAKGSFVVNGDGNEYSADVKDGVAKIPLSGFEYGEYDFYIEYIDENGDSILTWDDYSLEIKPVKPRLIVTKNIKMNYLDGKTLSVTVYDVNGRLAEADECVEVYIGGYYYEAYTNSKGVAKLKITVPPGKYKIKVNYEYEDGTIRVARSLFVKKTLKLNDLKLKKSSKKLVLKATLKQGKKAIKNKKITFKFNGKKIGTVKTNKKGVAQITIKPKLYKKLKVGKKIKYQATYVKETVKKTVKVQK